MAFYRCLSEVVVSSNPTKSFLLPLDDPPPVIIKIILKLKLSIMRDYMG